MSDLKAQILEALKAVQDPDLGKDIVSLGFVKNIALHKTLLGRFEVKFDIELTTPACPVKDDLHRQAQTLIENLAGVSKVEITMTARVKKSNADNAIPGIRNIIVVGSGKGGVGKSTVAVNLAFALKKLGARTALLDADIYGPSLGVMLKLAGMPKVKNHKILPMFVNDVPVMSFAFFAPIGEAVIWKGPQIAKATQQMMRDVDWTYNELGTGLAQDIDYLIIDLPPGTGDVPISILQSAPVAGAVLVSTPQEISWIDTQKGISLFEKLRVPVLGVVENMSGFICPHCDELTEIYGPSVVEGHLKEKNVALLGKIPMDPRVAQSGDGGLPLVEALPQHAIAKIFLKIAQSTSQKLSILAEQHLTQKSEAES